VPGTTEIFLHARQALVMDYHTGKILLEKNADELMPPSSMTKMLTSFIIEEKILKKELSVDTTFVVSEKAWKTEGSRMFLQVGTTVSVGDLLKGIVIQSGNDASVAAAEGIAGTEEHFALLMNEIARELGMKNSTFKNASGLPEEGHMSTARDLAILASAIIRQHSEFYHLYAEKEFTYNKIKQGNRNPLLYKDVGCDGIKTGSSDAGGYGVTASFVEGNQRYIIVINGLKSMHARAEESLKLLSWTKQNFLGKTVFKKGDVVEAAAPVWLGEKKTIPLKAVEDVTLLLPRSEHNKLEVKVQYDSPLQAPLTENQIVGKIIVNAPSLSYEVSLAAGESCDRASFFERMWHSLVYLISGKV
jgi:D-alanyl-D-alanine carboxypeptidase (penicillin-binding protein 5/6)